MKDVTRFSHQFSEEVGVEALDYYIIRRDSFKGGKKRFRRAIKGNVKETLYSKFLLFLTEDFAYITRINPLNESELVKANLIKVEYDKIELEMKEGKTKFFKPKVMLRVLDSKELTGEYSISSKSKSGDFDTVDDSVTFLLEAIDTYTVKKAEVIQRIEDEVEGKLGLSDKPKPSNYKDVEIDIDLVLKNSSDEELDKISKLSVDSDEYMEYMSKLNEKAKLVERIKESRKES